MSETFHIALCHLTYCKFKNIVWCQSEAHQYACGVWTIKVFNIKSAHSLNKKLIIQLIHCEENINVIFIWTFNYQLFAAVKTKYRLKKVFVYLNKAAHATYHAG